MALALVVGALGLSHAIGYWPYSLTPATRLPPQGGAQQSMNQDIWRTVYAASLLGVGLLYYLGRRTGVTGKKTQSPESLLPLAATPSSVSPLSVDLRGEILELYFHKDNDIPSFQEHITVVMKVQLVNHGTAEATVTRCGLHVCIGQERLAGSLVNHVPDSWRIKKRKAAGVLNLDYVETQIEPCLGEAPEHEIYRKGVPRVGWLAFEFHVLENIEFPNAKFTLSFRDSLGGDHCVERPPMLYRKVGTLLID